MIFLSLARSWSEVIPREELLTQSAGHVPTVSLRNCSPSLSPRIATSSTPSTEPAMGTDAGNEAREPLKDYRSALAKAKLLALEDSKERTRQRPPGSRRSSSDQKRSRPQTHPASTQGQKHATSIKPPSLHDRSAAAVVKQEPELEVPTLELIPQSSHPAAAPKPNQYAGLVSAKKRKWEEQSPEPGCATVISAARESRALQNRPFAPLKKPVKGPRPPYEDV